MTATLHQGDAVTWLRSLPSGSVDLIDTDIAYESLEKHRAIGTTTRLKKFFEIFPNVRLPDLFAECYRVLADNAHLYFWCDQETMFVAKPLAEAAGFTFWKPLIFDKVAIGMGYHYRARYELILFFEKGKRRLNSMSIPDVLTAERVLGAICDRCAQAGVDTLPLAADPDDEDAPGLCPACGAPRRKNYPTEKPVAIHRTLIEQSTNPGELVIDPFMGSASCGVAALAAGRRFAGNDLSDNSIAVARARMPDAVVVPDAPPFVEPGQRTLFGGGR